MLFLYFADGGVHRPSTADSAQPSAQHSGPLRVTIKGNWGTPARTPSGSNGAAAGRGTTGGDKPPKKKHRKNRDADAPLPKLKIKSAPQHNGGWDHQVAQAAAAAAVAGHSFGSGPNHYGGNSEPPAAALKAKRKTQKRPKGAPPKLPVGTPIQQQVHNPTWLCPSQLSDQVDPCVCAACVWIAKHASAAWALPPSN